MNLLTTPKSNSNNEKEKKGGMLKLSGKNKLLLWLAVGLLLFIFVLRAKKKIESSVKMKKNATRVQRGKMQESIFVAIAADLSNVDDAVNCIGRLFDAAKYPSRIFIGLCWTTDSTKHRRSGGYKSARFFEQYRDWFPEHGDLFERNISVLDEPRHEATGMANAFYMIQTFLYRGEKYYATVHPTLDVCTNWDSHAVKDLKRLLLRSEKCILTQMPFGDGEETATFMRFADWTEYGIPSIIPRPFVHPPVRPFRSLFWSSTFSFSIGSFATEVIQDYDLPHLERQAVDWLHAIRLWTEGWDFYSPTHGMIFERTKRENPIDLQKPNTPTNPPLPRLDTPSRQKSYSKLWSLLGITKETKVKRLDYFGNERTCAQYSTFCGLNWEQRIVNPHAPVGMAKKKPKNKFSNFEAERYPFETEEVVAKFGSWTEFLEITDYPT